MALQAAMSKHESDLRGLYNTLVGQVRHDLLGVRAELDATQASLRQVGGVAAAATTGTQAAPQPSPTGPPPPIVNPDPPPFALALGRVSRPASGPVLVPSTLSSCGPAQTTF